MYSLAQRCKAGGAKGANRKFVCRSPCTHSLQAASGPCLGLGEAGCLLSLGIFMPAYVFSSTPTLSYSIGSAGALDKVILLGFYAGLQKTISVMIACPVKTKHRDVCVHVSFSSINIPVVDHHPLAALQIVWVGNYKTCAERQRWSIAGPITQCLTSPLERAVCELRSICFLIHLQCLSDPLSGSSSQWEGEQWDCDQELLFISQLIVVFVRETTAVSTVIGTLTFLSAPCKVQQASDLLIPLRYISPSIIATPTKNFGLPSSVQHWSQVVNTQMAYLCTGKKIYSRVDCKTQRRTPERRAGEWRCPTNGFQWRCFRWQKISRGNWAEGREDIEF